MQAPTRSLHPLIWIAASAVILFSAVAVAAIMGWLPTTMGNSQKPAGAQTSELSAAQAVTIRDPVNHSPIDNRTDIEPVKIEHHKTPEHALSPTSAYVQPYTQPTLPPVKCNDCGVIEFTRAVDTNNQSSGIGAVGGALLGGVLGHQVGGGNGQDVATVAGALGGALAGNELEKHSRTLTRYETAVRFEDGTRQIFTSSTIPGWQAGDHVKVVNGQIQYNN